MAPVVQGVLAAEAARVGGLAVITTLLVDKVVY